MNVRPLYALLATAAVAVLPAMPAAHAQSTFFSTGSPDGLMAMASRPASTPSSTDEIEAADDFVLSTPMMIDGATFAGLVPAGFTASDIAAVDVEIYRVFPSDSTSPPSGNVPTRTNSPSDVAFDSRGTGTGDLTFGTSILSASFFANNSVLNGINPVPNQTTGGDGAVTGQEVALTVSFTTPFHLPTNHYFFVPQVRLSTGEFFWLSAPKPITAPGTPFTPDLQTWMRNSALAPDWLRVGTDIVGGSPAPTFNGAFSLAGTAAPEPGTLALALSAAVVLGGITGIRRRGHGIPAA